MPFFLDSISQMEIERHQPVTTATLAGTRRDATSRVTISRCTHGITRGPTMVARKLLWLLRTQAGRVPMAHFLPPTAVQPPQRALVTTSPFTRRTTANGLNRVRRPPKRSPPRPL